MTECVDVAVVGAGITGLAAAFAAKRAGASIAVFESEDRLGGVVKTVARDGFTVEGGPNTFVASTRTLDLLRSLALGPDILFPRSGVHRRYILRAGRLHELPHSPKTLITSGLLSARGKWRAISEVLVSKRVQDSEESLASLVRRRFGSEMLDYVVDPFVSGVYAGNPDKLSSRYALSVLRDLEQEHRSVILGAMRRRRAKRGLTSGVSRIISFRHGLNQLPIALAESLRGTIRTQCAVSQIERRDQSWSVFATTPQGQVVIRAKSVVFAVPAYALSAITLGCFPGKWPDAILSVRYVPVTTVALGYARNAVAHALDGFGMLIPSAEKRGILGAMFNSAMFPMCAPAGQVLLTAFLGGARCCSVPTEADAVDMATAELRATLGISAPPIFTHVERWSQGIPQYDAGHRQVLEQAASFEAANVGLILAGSYLHGLSLESCLDEGLAAGARAEKYRRPD